MDTHDVNEGAAELQGASEGAGTSRRRAIALAAGTVGVAWVTPAILSVDAASAATDPPPPVSGTLSGVVTFCGHELAPSDTFQLTATQNPGGFVASTPVPATGIYSLPGLPPGSYDVLLHPNTAPRPDQSYPAAAVVTAGGTTTFNPDYTANGC